MLYQNIKTKRIFYNISPSDATVSDGSKFYTPDEVHRMTQEDILINLEDQEAKILSIRDSIITYYCEPYYFKVPTTVSLVQTFYGTMKATKLLRWLMT